MAAWYAAHIAIAVPPSEFDPAAAPDLCAVCHGADGIVLVDGVPNLAPENTMYLETQLKAFRSGKREHEVMSPVASELDDPAVREVSEWYSAVGLKIAGP